MPVTLRISVLLKLASRSGIASIMDYSDQINEYTRFLYYSYVGQEERISNKITKKDKMKDLANFNAITHIVTGINYGIDIVVVLQLPAEDDISRKIDDVLESIRTFLSNDQSPLTLIEQKHDLLGQITSTVVYSNILSLRKMSTILDVCSYIDSRKNDAENYPIIYTLQPITWMFPQHAGRGANFTSPDVTFCEKVEQYFLKCSSTFKRAKYSLDTELTSTVSGKLDKQTNEARRQVLNLKTNYTIWRKRFHELILEIRRNHTKTSSLNDLLIDMERKTSSMIEKLTKLMKDLHEKEKLIVDLKKESIIFINAANCHMNERDNDDTLILKLKIKNRSARILCTTDELNKNHPKQYMEQRRLLADKCKDGLRSNGIYADFSYCPFKLLAMKILQSKPKKSKTKKKKTSVTKATSAKPKRATDETSPTSSPEPTQTSEEASSGIKDDVINILLLGESGVGKSTFINAFVNYLTSETFDRAQSDEPVVLIPASFVLTTGDHFEERTVKFGDFVSSHNEDFDHPGESVTQHCKSYEFHLDRSDGKKLCLIDTPGFGDTRGIEQDDMNMQHILEYVNNLTHLNAVCFLLKPNMSRINSFFRLCLTQLLDLIGPSIRQNIIFCFTNARSTFYSPGDTGPLLKKILDSLPTSTIPFNKNNTFCFDNESFRYLVALRNSISFNNLVRSEYEKSWEISVRESNRLIEYICKDLGTCSMHSEWKSNKHAQIAIRDMIRPMLEVMRNILRNVLMQKIESSQKSIELSPKPMHRPSALCSMCSLYPTRLSVFWIAHEITHEFRKKCSDCPCDTKEHTLINYVVNFELSVGPSIYQQNKTVDKAYEICQVGAEFDYFLTHITSSSKEGPFRKGLIRMIAEEDDLCQNQKSNHANLQLLEYLTKLQQHYDQSTTKFHSNRQQTSLTNIYQSITAIGRYPPIAIQLDAIKETQKLTTEPYEISREP